MSSLNAITPFHDHFGTDMSGSGTGLLFSIYAVGGLIGALFGGLASDTFGRRFGMVLGSSLIFIGVIVEVTAKEISQFIGGRFFIGFGVTISTIAGPVYLVEVSPPHWRGTFGGLSHVVGYYLGGLGKHHGLAQPMLEALETIC
jgi:MFS family permease